MINNMHSTFLTLPTEVKWHIAEHLSARSLLDLMCCARRFYDVLLPLFYENARLSDFPPGERLAGLVQTITQKPWLASHIRTLRVVCWEVKREQHTRWGAFDSEFHADDLDADIEKMAIECTGHNESELITDHRVVTGDKDYDFASTRAKVMLASRSRAEWKVWMSDLAEFNADAWVGLLLTLLPRLTRLELQIPYGTKYLPWVVSRAANGEFGSLPVLSSLRTVSLDWLDSECGLDFFTVAPLVRLPSMRQFHAYMLVEAVGDEDEEGRRDDEQYGPAAELAGTSPITHIELEESNGLCIGPRALIRSCKNLLTFKYHHDEENINGHDFDSRLLHCSLLHARHTLETLWLDCIIDFALPGALSVKDERIWSFREFTALKTLRIRPSGLLRSYVNFLDNRGVMAEALPRSIEDLQLAGDWIIDYIRDLEPVLEHHVRHDMDDTPALAQFLVKGVLRSPGPQRSLPQASTFEPQPLGTDMSDVFAGLGYHCAAAGISFSVDCSTKAPFYDSEDFGFRPRLFVK